MSSYLSSHSRRWRLFWYSRDALADDAALDHDGALRALFAGNHPRGGGTPGDAAGLLHFGQNRLDIHAHQRGGDLGLLLMVFGDPRGSENRLFQGRRVAPHTPGAVFGLPVFAHRASQIARRISRDVNVAL